MKKTILLLLALIFISTTWYCGRQKIEENKIFHIDLDNCKTAIDLKLSDLIDSCRLIPLETTNESLIGNFIKFLYISKNYIIVIDQNGVYKFLSNGKFVRKIINIGRGPDEIYRSGRYFYYEKDDILFIENDIVKNDLIMRYDIKLEMFLPSIKKCFPSRWTSFIVYEDSLILGSIEGLASGRTNPYALFIQNFKGEFISGLKSNRSCIPLSGEGEILQRMIICTGDKSIHVKYNYDDTLFTFNNNNLSLYLIPHYKDKKLIPRMIPLEGGRMVLFNRYENPSYMILTYSLLTSWRSLGEDWASAHYKHKYFLLDKYNGKYGAIKSFTDDFIGKMLTNENEIIAFPALLPNNKIYVSYLPNELLNKTTAQEKSNYFKQLYTQLDLISSKINETDNPVLLIGTPKNKIQVFKK